MAFNAFQSIAHPLFKSCLRRLVSPISTGVFRRRQTETPIHGMRWSRHRQDLHKVRCSVICCRRSVGVESAAVSHPRPPVDRLLQSRTEDLPVWLLVTELLTAAETMRQSSTVWLTCALVMSSSCYGALEIVGLLLLLLLVNVCVHVAAIWSEWWHQKQSRSGLCSLDVRPRNWRCAGNCKSCCLLTFCLPSS